jgi:hypothetical protein
MAKGSRQQPTPNKQQGKGKWRLERWKWSQLVVTWYVLVRVSSVLGWVERYIAIWADFSCSDVKLT